MGPSQETVRLVLILLFSIVYQCLTSDVPCDVQSWYNDMVAANNFPEVMNEDQHNAKSLVETIIKYGNGKATFDCDLLKSYEILFTKQEDDSCSKDASLEPEGDEVLKGHGSVVSDNNQFLQKDETNIDGAGTEPNKQQTENGKLLESGNGELFDKHRCRANDLFYTLVYPNKTFFRMNISVGSLSRSNDNNITESSRTEHVSAEVKRSGNETVTGSATGISEVNKTLSLADKTVINNTQSRSESIEQKQTTPITKFRRKRKKANMFVLCTISFCPTPEVEQRRYHKIIDSIRRNSSSLICHFITLLTEKSSRHLEEDEVIAGSVGKYDLCMQCNSKNLSYGFCYYFVEITRSSISVDQEPIKEKRACNLTTLCSIDKCMEPVLKNNRSYSLCYYFLATNNATEFSATSDLSSKENEGVDIVCLCKKVCMAGAFKNKSYAFCHYFLFKSSDGAVEDRHVMGMDWNWLCGVCMRAPSGNTSFAFCYYFYGLNEWRNFSDNPVIIKPRYRNLNSLCSGMCMRGIRSDISYTYCYLFTPPRAPTSSVGYAGVHGAVNLLLACSKSRSWTNTSLPVCHFVHLLKPSRNGKLLLSTSTVNPDITLHNLAQRCYQCHRKNTDFYFCYTFYFHADSFSNTLDDARLSTLQPRYDPCTHCGKKPKHQTHLKCFYKLMMEMTRHLSPSSSSVLEHINDATRRSCDVSKMRRKSSLFCFYNIIWHLRCSIFDFVHTPEHGFRDKVPEPSPNYTSSKTTHEKANDNDAKIYNSVHLETSERTQNVDNIVKEEKLTTHLDEVVTDSNVGSQHVNNAPPPPPVNDKQNENQDLQKTNTLLKIKNSEYATKMTELEMQIVRLENAILQGQLHKETDSTVVMKLENQILKLENELIRVSQDYNSLKTENKMLNKQQTRLTVRQDQTSSQHKNELQQLSGYQHRLNELTEHVKKQTNEMVMMSAKTSLLQQHNLILQEMVFNQSKIIASITSQVEEIVQKRIREEMEKVMKVAFESSNFVGASKQLDNSKPTVSVMQVSDGDGKVRAKSTAGQDDVTTKKENEEPHNYGPKEIKDNINQETDKKVQKVKSSIKDQDNKQLKQKVSKSAPSVKDSSDDTIDKSPQGGSAIKQNSEVSKSPKDPKDSRVEQKVDKSSHMKQTNKQNVKPTKEGKRNKETQEQIVDQKQQKARDATHGQNVKRTQQSPTKQETKNIQKPKEAINIKQSGSAQKDSKQIKSAQSPKQKPEQSTNVKKVQPAKNQQEHKTSTTKQVPRSDKSNDKSVDEGNSPEKPKYYREEYNLPKDCYDYFINGRKRDSAYELHLGNGNSLRAFCDMKNGGWTVIQRRTDGSTDFFRSWADYKQGFGGPLADHWLGNDHIHYITNSDDYILRIELMSWDREASYADYLLFRIDDEAEGYKLHIGGYQGDSGDGMSKHNLEKFSTYDKDNDKAEKEFNGSCAKRFSGGWWYYKCYKANLNGRYYKNGVVDEGRFDGISWKPLKGPGYSFKKVVMKIIPMRSR